MASPENEIILYQPDSTVKLEVRLENETVWLTQQQMTELFQTSKQNIILHISNIFKEGELDSNSVVKDYLTTDSDGKKYKTKYYNLDFIISVGYRFRQWANRVIKDYLMKGYAVSQRFERLVYRMANNEEYHQTA
ncbi:MAG: death-on-curing protein [Bacteroidales bacterium]|nr:death-on-curing protein [Bacteroidales bacterium]MBD5190875.1 death-on-curing protein [Bacteroidales bacterium]